MKPEQLEVGKEYTFHGITWTYIEYKDTYYRFLYKGNNLTTSVSEKYLISNVKPAE